MTLANLARVRAAGFAPWLILLAWIAAAAFQEPRFLRLYGIYLLQEAAWSGGTLLLLVLLLAEPYRSRVGARSANLLLLVCIACLQAVLGFAFDAAIALAAPQPHAWQLFGFILCWAPLALTMATRVGSRRTLLHGLVAVFAFAIGGLLSVSWCRDDRAQTLLAAFLASVGALAWPRPRFT